MISGNKRKMLIILIAAVLGMSLMTGCGSKPTETPETGAPETGADADRKSTRLTPVTMLSRMPSSA